ncbi:MAG: hypothetical protein HY606_12820 [Planctomycetes bacterium]|nr:hypothetical protein [Planctomycetota bacterium]
MNILLNCMGMLTSYYTWLFRLSFVVVVILISIRTTHGYGNIMAYFTQESNNEWSDQNPETSGRRISTSPGSGLNYSVGLDMSMPAKFFFAYEFKNSSGDYDIALRRINDASVLTPSDELVISGSGSQRNPSVTVGVGKVCVVWEDNSSGKSRINFRAVPSALNLGTSSVVELNIPAGSNNLKDPYIIFIDILNSYAVLYVEEIAGTSKKLIKIVRINVLGSVIGIPIEICSIESNKKDIKTLWDFYIPVDPPDNSIDRKLTVVWSDDRNGNWDIYMQVVGFGLPPTPFANVYSGWTANGVLVAGSEYDQENPDVAITMAGQEVTAYVSYEENLAGNSDVRACKVSKVDGEAKTVWDLNLADYTFATQKQPVIAVDSLNRVSVAFEQEESAGNRDIIAAVVDGETGEKLFSLAICTDTADQANPSIAHLEDNSTVIAWEDGRNLAIGGVDIYCQKINTGASAIGWLDKVNGISVSTKAGNQTDPKIYRDRSTVNVDALITYSDYSIDNNSTLTAQIVSSVGCLIRPNKPTGFQKTLQFDWDIPSVKVCFSLENKSTMGGVGFALMQIKYVNKNQVAMSKIGDVSIYSEDDSFVLGTPIESLNFNSKEILFACAANSGCSSLSPPLKGAFDLYPKPYDFQVTALSEMTVELKFKWNKVQYGNPTGLAIARKLLCPGEIFTEVKTVSLNSGTLSGDVYSYNIIDSGLNPGAKYEYAVRVYTSTEGTSSFTSVVETQTQGPEYICPDNEPEEGEQNNTGNNNNNSNGSSHGKQSSNSGSSNNKGEVFIPNPPQAPAAPPSVSLVNEHAGKIKPLCYVATATFGFGLVEQLATIMRGRILVLNIVGKISSEIYSKMAPSLASLIAVKLGYLWLVVLCVVTVFFFRIKGSQT